MKTLASLCSLILFLSACANEGIKRADIDQFVEIIYGKVINTQPIKFNSNADKAAVIGAIEGAIENSDRNSSDIFRGALIGAVISSTLVSLEEGSDKGLLVEIESKEGVHHSLSIQNTHILLGDCLRVVNGNDVSFKVVDNSFCHNPY